ncbi:MAG: hypothetical protein HOA17_02680 [Candidatus Melainabacteria bacterium]|jgi:Flp pilus assembly protein CpaB|nr:hypothetical protein [Candidatus Melainabacteria bacterium]
MSTIHSELGSGQLNRFLWGFSYKNRKVLIPVLIAIIIVGAIFLMQKYIAMDMQLRQLSRYEPIYVLAVKRDINIGDVISISDLKPIVFYKEEFQKMSWKNPETQLVEPSFVSCDFDPETQQLTGFDDILGRVASIPIAANSILQRELLAPQGTLPGLINLLDKNHSLIDLSVPQLGFNVFIKPNDLVDLYQVYESSSKLIASKVKVILVDSKPLGKAPLRVAVSNKSRRELTVSIPEEYFSTVVKAKKNKRLIVTYKNKERELVQVPRIDQAFKSKSLFQSLLMIHGPTKEVFGQ